MSDNNVWANPISDGDRIGFISKAMERFPDASIDIEDVTLRYDFLIAPDQVVGIGPTQLAIADVFTLAGDAATCAGPTDNTTQLGQPSWLTTRTQDPSIGGENRTTPRSQLIMIGGIGVVVDMEGLELLAHVTTPTEGGAYELTAPAQDAINGIQQAFLASTWQLLNARVRRAEVVGHECVSFGGGRIGLFTPPALVTDGELEATVEPIYSGQVSARERGWRRTLPIIVGADQQLSLLGYIPRRTEWPLRRETRMRVSVMMPSLIARVGGPPTEGCGDDKYPGGIYPGPVRR